MAKQGKGKLEAAIEAHAPRVRELSLEGATRTEVAEKLGIPYILVKAICDRLRMPRARKPTALEKMSPDWTHTNVEIAQALGVPVAHVVATRGRLRKLGLPIPPAPLIGPLRLDRKNWWGEALPMLPKIRKLASPKLSVDDLCKMVKLPEEIVSQILRRLRLPFRPPPAVTQPPRPSRGGRPGNQPR